MNINQGIFTAPQALRCLVLDLNSFFASCEQQENPELRHRPVAVIPARTLTTCAIAASYEAKAFGVKTGTRLSEALEMCPGLVMVEARHKLYVEYHHRIIEAIETCIPVDRVMSIDEVACRLDSAECDPIRARSGTAYQSGDPRPRGRLPDQFDRHCLESDASEICLEFPETGWADYL